MTSSEPDISQVKIEELSISSKSSPACDLDSLPPGCPVVQLTRQFAVIQPSVAEMQLDPLLVAFEGICGFLDALAIGPLGFVRKDIQEKIQAIKRQRDAVHSDPSSIQIPASSPSDASSPAPAPASEPPALPYVLLVGCFEYECGLRINKQKTSVVWNLVRLKRALYFIARFLSGLNDPSVPVSTACGTAYTSTFETIHPWAVRSLVSVAVHALPSRAGLIQRLSLGSEEEAQQIIAVAVDTLHPVLSVIQTCFDNYGLGHLK